MSITGCTLAGLGGIGKTQLALSFAYEALEQGAYDYIHWIYSETEENLISSYKSLLNKINISVLDQNVSNNYIIELVKNKLPERYNKCLLIYDNVPSPEDIKDKCPPENGHILITSRYPLDWSYSQVNLNVWQPEEAVRYLLKYIRKEDTLTNREAAFKVAKALGYLPLALSHAASYIENQDISLERYLERFNKKAQEILKYYPNNSSYPHAVATTWKITKESFTSRAQANKLFLLL